MEHRSNYDEMLFLTLPMAFVWVQKYDFMTTAAHTELYFKYEVKYSKINLQLPSFRNIIKC